MPTRSRPPGPSPRPKKMFGHVKRVSRGDRVYFYFQIRRDGRTIRLRLPAGAEDRALRVYELVQQLAAGTGPASARRALALPAGE